MLVCQGIPSLIYLKGLFYCTPKGTSFAVFTLTKKNILDVNFKMFAKT